MSEDQQGTDQGQTHQGPTIESRLEKLEEFPRETYEQKVVDIRRDFAILVDKLHSHGIHVDLDPKVPAVGEASEVEAGEEV